MSNFLAHLVQRSQGLIGDIQPRLLSQFESLQVPVGLEVELATERVSDRSAVPPGLNHRPVNDAAPMEWETPSIEQVSRLITQPSQSDRLIAEPYPQQTGSGELSDSTESIRPTPHPIAPTINSTLSQPDVQTSPEVPNQLEASESRQTPLLHPQITRVSEPQPVPPPVVQSEPPMIKVTIGRVEVRAISTPTASPRPAPPVSRPAMSLDDYLKARNGGKR